MTEDINPGTTMYLTRFVLTRGIVKQTVKSVDRCYVNTTGTWRCLKIGTEAYLSRADAIKDAESRRTKKIASLKAQIEKLEGMVFE